MGVLDRERDLPRIRGKYIHEMTTDPADIWIKVTDKASGRIVAGSNWRIYLHGPPADRPMDTIPEWVEGDVRARSEAFVGGAEKTRKEVMEGVGFIREFAFHYLSFLHSSEGRPFADRCTA